MDERLRRAYNNVLNKHHAVTQTDTELKFSDDSTLEKKAKLFWAQYCEAEAAFSALLERCTIHDDG